MTVGAAPAAQLPPECDGAGAAGERSRLGTRILARMETTATPALLRQARKGEIGGVVLFPGEPVDVDALRRQIAKLQVAAAEAGEHPLLVAIDQEGGEVKRLPEAPPRRSAPEMGERGAAEAASEGYATGRFLARLGINVDLAPVLDVPDSPASFIAGRAFGTSAGRVGRAGTAFATGLRKGGIAATAKHFPGLGRADANTDLAAAEVIEDKRDLRADLAPFQAAIDARVSLVMLSNATYPALDRSAPAFASPAIAEELLRVRMGFTGVTVTDDLGAAAVEAMYPSGAGRAAAQRSRVEAAVAAATGGSDLLLFAQTSSPRVLDGLVRASRFDPGDRASRIDACVRVISLRSALGDT